MWEMKRQLAPSIEKPSELSPRVFAFRYRYARLSITVDVGRRVLLLLPQE